MQAPQTTAMLAAALLLSGCQSLLQGDPSDSSSQTLAAEVDGRGITLEELDDWIRQRLFEEETEGDEGRLYELRKQNLEELTFQRALANEARRRGLSPQELIEAEVDALGPVTDQEVEDFYAENEDRLVNQSLDELRPRIREFLEQQRRRQALDAIRDRADVVVYLAPTRFRVSSQGPAIGPEDAAVTIVEFSDFQCPYCRRANDTLKQLRERYPSQLRVVYKQFPLDNIHPRARAAAEASLCAADQDRFWDYHDLLFESASALADEDLQRFAERAELDLAAFQDCFEGGVHAQTVEADVAEGIEAGVSGTPAFFVNGIKLSGAKSVESFSEVIDAELERLGGQPPGAPSS